MIFCRYTSGLLNKLGIEGNCGYIISHDELPNEREIHHNLFSLASLIWKISEDLFTTVSANVFVLIAECSHLSIIDLHFRDDTACSFIVKRSDLLSSIMRDTRLEVYRTNEVFSHYEYGFSNLLVSLVRVSSSSKIHQCRCESEVTKLGDSNSSSISKLFSDIWSEALPYDLHCFLIKRIALLKESINSGVKLIVFSLPSKRGSWEISTCCGRTGSTGAVETVLIYHLIYFIS